jgi:hypothetical protein
MDLSIPRKRGMKKKSMFGKAKSKAIADVVSFTNPQAAERSVRELEGMFKQAKKRAKKVHILKATVLASNRAEASAIRVSPKERKELKKVAAIYKQSSQRMSRSLSQKKRKW